MGSADGADETSGKTSYCPNCGSAVDDTDSYCGQCGHDLARSVGPSEQDFRQFRARVSDHVADGWDIQYDAGDEVALVDRGYGSVLVHILLFFPTSGIGNLLYGWYHYEHSAERKVIRARGPDSTPTGRRAETAVRHEPESTETADSSLSSYAWGLLLIVLAVASLTSMGLSSVGMTITLALLLLAMLVLPPTRRRIENRHPPTTFGPTTSVDERFVSDTDKPCAVCFDRVDHGVKREYEQSSVVAGLPLYTIERGENWYCESCREEITDATAVPGDSLDAELASMTEGWDESFSQTDGEQLSAGDAEATGSSAGASDGTADADSLNTVESPASDTTADARGTTAGDPGDQSDGRDDDATLLGDES